MSGEASEKAIRAARERAALFAGDTRGWLEVSGGDRVRWLDGMISGDVEALEAGPEGAGCYATLLTNRGAIVADLHVAKIGETFVLETLRSEVARIAGVLDRFVIADDVTLVDLSPEFEWIGLEGPASAEILAAALGSAGESDVLPAPLQWRATRLAGHDVVIGRFGWTGEDAYQLRVPVGASDAVASALDAAAGAPIVRGDADALDVLRVEAGIPALGRELDEEVLPPEARLEHAICPDKGCYVGQEIVARLRSRGQVNHLLVGLELEGAPSSLPEAGTELRADERATGELTTVVRSPAVGAIALGYVRRAHAEPGTVVTWTGGVATVRALPFVPLPDRADAPPSGRTTGDGAA